MLFSDSTLRAFRRIAALATGFSALICASCSVQHEDPSVQDKGASRYRGYSVKYFVKEDAGFVMREAFPMQLSPGTFDLLSPSKGPMSRGTSSNAAHDEDVAQKGQALSYDSGSGIVNTDSLPWLIASWAANVCKVEPGAGDFWGITGSTNWPETVQNRAVTYGLYVSTFSGGSAGLFQTCDDVLYLAENALCVAGKIAEASRAVAPMKLDFGSGSSVVIIPQAEKDKFILRDMAINMLAHVANLDSVRRAMSSNGSDYGDTCIPRLVELYQTPSLVNATTSALVLGTGGHGNRVIPGVDASLPIVPANAEKLIVPRLKFHAHQVRAAARLLRGLVEDAVFADRGEAELKQAEGGPASAWGMNATDSFGTNRHAVKILYGRTEAELPVAVPTGGPTYGTYRTWAALKQHDIYASKYDPACFGYTNVRGAASTDILDAQSDFSFRVRITQPRTAGQALASSLVERSGMIFPGFSTRSDGALLDAVRVEVLRQAAVKLGEPASTLASVNDFGAEHSAGIALTASLREFSSDDLRFALKRSNSVYSTLLGELVPDDATYTKSNRIPLDTVFDGHAWHPLNSAGGFVLREPLPVSDLSASPVGQISAAVASSACPLVTKGIDTFQDVVSAGAHMAESLRLVKGAVGKLADDGFQEIASWAGVVEGGNAEVPYFRAIVHPIPDNAASTQDWVEIGRLPIGLVDATSLADLPNRIQFVLGTQQEAECAAGLRRACPSTAADAILIPQQENSTTTAGTTNSAYLRMSFKRKSGSISYTNPNSQLNRNQLLYAVALSGAKKGRVLGVLPVGKGEFITRISSWRDDLAGGLLFGGQRTPQADAECSVSYTSTSRDYCIPGMAKDTLIPVTNDLTDDGSVGDDVDQSWRHYLELARASANEADSLGQDLIELGTKTDLRREGARTALGDLCGGLPNDPSSSGVVVDKGIDQCVNEPTVDAVFFTSVPGDFENVVRAGACAYWPNLEICRKNASSWWTESLGFKAPATTIKNESGTTCDSILSSAGKVLAGGSFEKETFDVFALSPAMSKAKLTSAANLMSLKVDPEGSWVMMRSGKPIMAWLNTSGIADQTDAGSGFASGDFGLFPGCSAAPSSWTCQNSDRDGCCNATGKAIKKRLGGRVPTDRVAYLRNLEAGLWFTGVAAGAIPRGMFDLPVPVGSWGSGHAPSGTSLPSSLIVGNSNFVSAGSRTYSFLNKRAPSLTSFRLSPTGNSTELSEGVGYVYRLNDVGRAGIPWLSDWLAGGDGVPAGLIQNESGQYVAVSDAWLLVGQAVNEARTFPSTNAADMLLGGTYFAKSNESCFLGSKPNFPFRPVVKVLQSDCDYASNESVYEKFSSFLPNLGDELVIRGTNSDLGLPCTLFGAFTQNCATSSMTSDKQDPCQGSLGSCDDTCTDYVERTVQKEILSGCRLEHRASLFLDSEASAAVRVATAGVASCLAQERPVLSIGVPPRVTSSADVASVAAWLSAQADSIAESQGRMFALDVPTGAVEYHTQKKVPYGLVGQGERGKQVLAVASALEETDRGFRVIQDGLRGMSSAVGGTQLAIEAAELKGQQDLLGIAFEKVELGRLMANAGISIAFGAAKAANILSVDTNQRITGVEEATRGVVDLVAYASERGIVEDKKKNSLASTANELSKALLVLNDQLAEGVSKIQDGISMIREAQISQLTAAADIQSRQNEASFQEAVMLGADFATVTDSFGVESKVAIPVNTVYRRQYDYTRIRYDRALLRAKRYAYLARLAIEQRLGVKMAELDDEVGVLEAPSSWVDSVCSMQGIDYNALRKAYQGEEGRFFLTGGASIPEEQVVRGFADSFIGDYVSKLEDFVESFNLEYPSQASDDVAVLSLKETFLAGTQCDSQVQNLLASSGDLTFGGSSEAPVWGTTGCSESLCLQLKDGAGGADQSRSIPWSSPTPFGGGSLLIAAPNLAGPSPAPDRPRNFVFQGVFLTSGQTYQLSWSDSAVDSSGNVSDAAAVSYRPLVVGLDWEGIDFRTESTQVGDSSEMEWSTRKVFEFSVPKDGDYRVGFQVLDEGALAIGSVQLAVNNFASEATIPYVHNEIGRLTGCDLASRSSLADHFSRKCDEGACFYELDSGFRLSEAAIVSGQVSDDGIGGATITIVTVALL